MIFHNPTEGGRGEVVLFFGIFDSGGVARTYSVRGVRNGYYRESAMEKRALRYRRNASRGIRTRNFYPNRLAA